MSQSITETMPSNSSSNNQGIYDYLVETLDGTGAKIEKLDNGGIWVSNWKAEGAFDNQLYIPPNIDSNNVSMISYLPGSGGFATDAQPLRNKILSDTPPNCIITLAQGCTDKGNTMEAAATICTDNGLEITNLTVQTFSASGGVGFQQLEKFLEENPNVNATMIVADGYNMDVGTMYYNNIDTLADNDVPIILVNPHNNRLNYPANYLSERGLNVYIIESDRGGHTDINKDIINNGLLEYSLGIADEFGGPNNNLDKCNYTIYKYDADYSDPNRQNRNFIQLDSFEEIRQENETYGYTLERLTSNPFDDGSVGADMYGVVSSLNSIRQTMNSQEVYLPTHTSTSTIPNNLMNAETSLLGISGELNGTIYKETQVISSIAQVFYDMDRERSNAAAGLSNGEVQFDESNYIDVLNQLISYDITSEIQFDSFLFDPFSHTEGNSGKICLSDLTSMLSGSSLTGPLHDNLENERQSAKNIKTEIDNLNTLISSGGNFTGSIWTAVGSRLSNYSDLMTLRINSADILESAIARAIKLIVDYMGDYEELDDSKLPELKEKAEQVKQEILNAQAIIDATHNVKYSKEGENGQTIYYTVTEYIYSVDARKEARKYITSARLLLIEINKEINKLENLPIVLAEAEQIINDALSDIYSNYGVKVGNTITGKNVSYIPPQNTNYVAPVYSKPEVFSTYGSVEGKVDEDVFMMSLGLQNMYGTYEDYLNGVYRENNPMYNPNKEDNGIEPGQTLNDKIFDKSDENEVEEINDIPDEKEENDTPSPTTQNSNPNTTPSADKPSGSNNTTPSQPTTEIPADSDTNTPSQPTTEIPSDSDTNTPSQPTTEIPSDSDTNTPSQPTTEIPSDSDTNTPSQPTTEIPSDSDTNTPSQPTTEIPSDSDTNTPSQPTTEIPADSDTNTPSQPNPSISPSKPDNNIGNSNVDGTIIIDTPADTETPVVDVPPVIEIPDNNELPIIETPIIDDPIIDSKPIDITPNTNENNISISSNNSSDGINLAKAIGVSLGVGAAVGAAALGAHTIKKSKENNLYED